MGGRWRRVQEGLKQKWNVNSEKGFTATSNSRNELMMEEAAKLATQLRDIVTHVKKMQKDIHSMISDTRKIMLCSLPRTFDFAPSGQAVPEDPDPKLIGQNVQLDLFASADTTLKQRLDEKVVVPLEAWLNAFQAVQVHMRKLEALRLELDSRRRTVDNLHAVCERQKLALDESNEKLRERHQNTLQTMQHKERKKNAVLNAFHEQEANIYNALSTLLKDTACLKDYTAESYSILQEVFGTVHNAFDVREWHGQGPTSLSSQPQSPDHQHYMQSPTSQKSSSPGGPLRNGSGGFRSRKTDSANTDDSQYYGNGHGVYDNTSASTGDNVHPQCYPIIGAADHYKHPMNGYA